MKYKKEMVANQDKDRLRHFKRLCDEDDLHDDDNNDDTASICMVGQIINLRHL